MAKMDDTTHDFLEELCSTMKSYDDWLSEAGRDKRKREMMFAKEFLEENEHILVDDQRREEIQRFVRHALSSMVFNMLVLFDERKECGSTKVRPRIKLMRDGVEVPCPNYLHELIGYLMIDAGMDMYEWMGVK